MNIICTGDWHIRATPTKYRNSDYCDLLFGKIEWIFNFAEKRNCSVILQPGDFFDSSTIPNHVGARLAKIILNYSGDIYTIFGQHDTEYRRHDNTILELFNSASILNILDDPIEYADEQQKLIHIYGASFGKNIPEPIDKEVCNILILHKMIVKDKPLFPDQTNYQKSGDFIKEYKRYDLIISGDNHTSFSNISQGSALVNCGSLMRMTTAQYEHKPCIWMLNTKTNELTQHFIPILPIEEVFKAEAEEIKEKNEEIQAFIKILEKTDTTPYLKFEDNVKELLQSKNIPGTIKLKANEFITDYYMQKGE